MNLSVVSVERFDQNAIGNQFADALLNPPRAALGEDGLEVAFEEGAGVLEVLFGVGFGGGEALKRFVQQADDPLLFGQRGTGNSISRICFDEMCFTVV